MELERSRRPFSYPLNVCGIDLQKMRAINVLSSIGFIVISLMIIIGEYERNPQIALDTLLGTSIGYLGIDGIRKAISIEKSNSGGSKDGGPLPKTQSRKNHKS